MIRLTASLFGRLFVNFVNLSTTNSLFSYPSQDMRLMFYNISDVQRFERHG